MVTKSILTVFGFNLDLLPDNSFIEGFCEINMRGELIVNYHKDFLDKTFLIFERIELKKIDNICRNIFFKSLNLDKLDLKRVKEMINEFYEIYGIDDNHKGLWSIEDLQLYNDKKFYQLFGRTWSGLETDIKYPCSFGIDREENVFTLSLWGIGQ